MFVTTFDLVIFIFKNRMSAPGVHCRQCLCLFIHCQPDVLAYIQVGSCLMFRISFLPRIRWIQSKFYSIWTCKSLRHFQGMLWSLRRRPKRQEYGNVCREVGSWNIHVRSSMLNFPLLQCFPAEYQILCQQVIADRNELNKQLNVVIGNSINVSLSGSFCSSEQ